MDRRVARFPSRLFVLHAFATHETAMFIEFLRLGPKQTAHVPADTGTWAGRLRVNQGKNEQRGLPSSRARKVQQEHPIYSRPISSYCTVNVNVALCEMEADEAVTTIEAVPPVVFGMPP